MTAPLIETDNLQALLNMIYARSLDITDRAPEGRRRCPQTPSVRLRVRPDIQVLVGLVLAYCTVTGQELPQPYLAAYDQAVRATKRNPAYV